MTAEDQKFYKMIKKTFWQVCASLSVIVIVSLFAFYYNTQATIRYQDEQIKEIKCKIDQLISLHLKN